MPGGRTKFQEKWFEEKDDNGFLIGSWCKKGRTEWEAYCVVCNSHLAVCNGGMSVLRNHALRQKHISVAKQLKGQKKLINFTNSKDDVSTPESFSNIDQLVIKAEALWCMKIANSNFSFSSCKDIVPLFQEMFDNPIASKMQLGERKISYVISHGLGPYFCDEFTFDIKAAAESNNYFTLSFDETTTSQIKKQLDILVRFWNKKTNKVVCGYLTSIFLGHATSEILCKAIMDALRSFNIPLNKILMLSMDGPNVNLAIERKLNKALTDSGLSELVNIGTCSLHKVHNCFSKSLNNLPINVDEFAGDLFSFFKLSAARREDLKNLEVLLDCEQKFLLRHVSTRWLTLGPVIARILEIFPALKEYFLEFLPKQKSSRTVQKNERYRRICSILKDPLTVAYLEFLLALTPCLTMYLNVFQAEGPLVHLLYNKMNLLLRNIMSKFMKDDCVGLLEGKKLLSVDIENQENYKALKDIDVGAGTLRALFSLEENEIRAARLTMRLFLIKLSQHLREALPIADGFLKDLEQIHPALRSNENDNAIRRLCMRLKPLSMTDEVIDKIVSEFRMYKLDKEVDSLWSNMKSGEKQIDVFWAKVFSLVDKFTGAEKYQHLPILIKNCLALSHGNADIERGFSVNHSILSDNRQCLSESCIVGIRHIKDAVRRNGGVLNVPITKKMITYMAKAYSAYKSEKEVMENSKKNAAEEEKLKLAIEEKLSKNEKLLNIDKEIKELQQELISAQNYLKESNERLNISIEKKNFGDAKVASMAINVATKRIQDTTNDLNKAHAKRIKL